MPEILQPTVYNPAALGTMDNSQHLPSLGEEHTYDVVDDASGTPTFFFTAKYSPTSTYLPSAVSPRSATDLDFPTPKARLFDMTPQPSPRYPRSATYPPPARTHREDSDYDSLYDITDDEADLPLHASASVKHSTTKPRHNRYPSIVIPSPSVWPTIDKLRSATSAVPMTPSHLLTPSRKVLDMIDSHNLQVPERSAAPSLDGSLTSEELDRLSCPATPDIKARRDSFSSVDSWAPVQLDIQALETLQHLGNSPSEEQYQAQATEIRGEMREVARPSLALEIPSTTSEGSNESTPISALSVPSPGGFFSSLKTSVRHTWAMPEQSEDSVPNTSTAENFYSLPWGERRNTAPPPLPTLPPRASTLGGSTLDGFEEPLETARPSNIFSPIDDSVEIKEINPSKTTFQYNENYNAELQKISCANLEMTGRWLEDQDELQVAIRNMGDASSPSLSTGSHSRDDSLEKVAIRKTVTFVEPESVAAEETKPEPIMTYVQGLEFIRSRAQKRDTFIHRQTRAEAMHLQRRCNVLAHRDQLLGKFELSERERPAPPRPVSEFFVNDPTVLKERIARAQTERQALDQMLPAHWVLQAQKQLNGGKLLSKPAVRAVTRASSPRILDVGGAPTNDWAWNVAYDFPYATVTTVYTAGNNLSPNLASPDNHKHLTVPNLWTLPFPNAHFDVISARTLYELLKTAKPLGRSADEYDLCIKEIYRCLKPGGIFEYNLLDADMIQAGRNAQAMGVEFGFNLKTRGYDAQATKTFLPRLNKAGFKDIQRAWVVLPMGKTAAHWRDTLAVGAEPVHQEKRISTNGAVEVKDAPVFGSTVDAAMLTGIVGSWMWERWLLRLQIEMGKEEEKLLEGVVQILEESAEKCAAWRTLTGYARK